MTSLPFVFAHGWGFDDSMWDKVLEELSPQNSVFLVDLWQDTLPDLPPRFIGIGHSLGLMWLLQHFSARLEHLISISGTPYFLADDSAPHGTSRRVLTAMHKQFQEIPLKVLSGFWQACGLDCSSLTYPLGMQKTVPHPPLSRGERGLERENVETPSPLGRGGGEGLAGKISTTHVPCRSLSQGLTWLETWDCRSLLSPALPCDALHAADDQIISLAAATHYFGERVTVLQSNSHALPLTHPKECATHIARVLSSRCTHL